MNVPICLSLAFISTTSIYRDFGVPFMTSPRKLPAACSVCIERPVKNSEVFQSKLILDVGGLRHE